MSVLLVLIRPLVLAKHSAYITPMALGLYKAREELPLLYAARFKFMASSSRWPCLLVGIWMTFPGTITHCFLLDYLTFFPLLGPSAPLPFVLLLVDLVSLSLTQVRMMIHPLIFPMVTSTSSLSTWLTCPRFFLLWADYPCS